MFYIEKNKKLYLNV